MASELAMFGYNAGGAGPELRRRFARFSHVLGKASKLDVPLFEASSYEELEEAVIAGYVDVAWLPPIPFVRLQRKSAVTPLVHIHRGGTSTYCSVLIVRAGSAIVAPADLAGTRAAWVDPFSASGFVVPCAELAKLGVDARVAFSQQRFWRSHESVVSAVVGGLADFGATYAGVDADGRVTRGPWLREEVAQEAVRVLRTFAGIPGDVVAARAGLEPTLRERLQRGLLAVSRSKRSRLLANDAFGVDEFRPFAAVGYEELRLTVEAALDEGLLDAAMPSRRPQAHLQKPS